MGGGGSPGCSSTSKRAWSAENSMRAAGVELTTASAQALSVKMASGL